MICPKCGHDNFDGAIDCLKCGIIFSRYAASAAERARREEEARKDEKRRREAQRLLEERALLEEELRLAKAEKSARDEHMRLEAGKQCPYCMEKIHADARKCKHCGAQQTSENHFMIKNGKHINPDAKGVLIGNVDKKTLVFAALVIVFGIIHALNGPPEAPEAKKISDNNISLSAAVFFTGTQFKIENNDEFDWRDITFELNNPGVFSTGYVLSEKVIPAKSVYTVGAMQFAKPDGERFNPITMKPVSMWIRCKVKDGSSGLYAASW